MPCTTRKKSPPFCSSPARSEASCPKHKYKKARRTASDAAARSGAAPRSAHSTSAANHPEGSKKKDITDTMDLVLERSDLFQVGTVSHRHTLALVSGAKSGRARVVVGDDHGETPGREPNFAGAPSRDARSSCAAWRVKTSSKRRRRSRPDSTEASGRSARERTAFDDFCSVGLLASSSRRTSRRQDRSARPSHRQDQSARPAGDVECFELKRGEPTSVFKTRAGEGAVQAVCVGGVAGKNDRVFVAQGQTVVGLGRKGKQFFSLQSSLVEPIHHMVVDEALLFTGCDYVYNRRFARAELMLASDLPRRRVAAAPRLATWIVRGSESRRRRGCHVDIPW